jgi:MbtH protein
MHDEDLDTYRVAIGPQEQYSLWPAHGELPPGWRNAGRVGTKAECLAYLAEVWSTMRPLTLPKRGG